MPEPLVEMRRVSKVYEPASRALRILVRTQVTEPVTALSDVSLELRPGEVCAVVGPNGAGKTTMFRVLVGLTTPTSGSAAVMGFDSTSEGLHVRRRIGWMPVEDSSLYLRLTTRENLRFHGRLQGMAGSRLSAAIDDVLELVDLGHAASRAAAALSAGMKARLRLARALMHRPKVLVLDEPTASVDPVGSYQLIETITQVVEERRLAALISSHRLDEIEALHSRVILLNLGEMLFDGDLDALRARLDRPHFEVGVAAGGALGIASQLRAMAGVKVLGADDRAVRFVTADGGRIGSVLGQITVLGSITSVREVQVPLRQILAEVYGASQSPESD